MGKFKVGDILEFKSRFNQNKKGLLKIIDVTNTYYKVKVIKDPFNYYYSYEFPLLKNKCDENNWPDVTLISSWHNTKLGRILYK